MGRAKTGKGWVARHRNFRGAALTSALALICCASPFAAAQLVQFDQSSDPPGIVASSGHVESGSSVTTLTAPVESSGLRFTHWTLNGVRQQDGTGGGLNPVAFPIYENTLAVAHYLAMTNDGDSDKVADWYEIHFCGTLANAASSDADLDGFSLRAEYDRDYHPNLTDATLGGGIARRRSAGAFLLLNPRFSLYAENSVPPGYASRQMVVSNGTWVATTDLHGSDAHCTFAFWTVDGMRQEDLAGSALSRAVFTVTNNAVATAHYFLTDEDMDADGVPDWFEWQHCGTLGFAASSDIESDGVSLRDEYRRDYIPRLADRFEDGGIARRRSDMAAIDLAGFGKYVIQSEPPELISSQSGWTALGTLLTTPAVHGEASGNVFSYWTINGLRQEDPMGMALSQVSFVMTNDMRVVAHFILEAADGDADGVRDWYEWSEYGTAAHAPGSDTDGDGMDLLDEYQRDYRANLVDTIADGGVDRRRSLPAVMNLQFFERLQYAAVDGVVTQWFSLWPPAVEGVDGGQNTAPAVGDWDGDGDLDVFVGASGGVVRIYENIGTRYTLNLSDRSTAFTGCAAGWNTMPDPSPALGDWNGDGADDLAVGGDDGRVRIMSSTADFFSPQAPAVNYDLPVNGSTNAIPAFAEMTGDANLDLIVLLDGGSVRVYANTGNASAPFSEGNYTDDLLGTAVPGGTGLAAADANRDGHPDVLVSTQDGRIWDFWGNASSTFTLKSKVWAGTGSGFANRLMLSVADLDGDSDMDALCGFAQGGLMYLRDPKIGPPAGLQAFGGPGSVLLQWEPDRQTRVLGYYVYRGASATGTFARLTAEPVALPEYRDMAAPAGAPNFYYVTAVSAAYLPGNTIPRMAESPPSDVVSAAPRTVVLWMPDYAGRRGDWAVLQVNVENADGLSGSGLDIRIAYDPAVIRPAAQVNATNATVHQTPLSESFTLSDNGASATGLLQITGSGGSAVAGEGRLLNVAFGVSTGAVLGAKTTNTIVLAALRDSGGQAMAVDFSGPAVLTVATAYFLGDVDGDGDLDMDDHGLLMELLKKNSPPPAPEELCAGDINGNGELDQGDIPLLNRLIHGLPIYPDN